MTVIAEFEKPTKCEDCPCFYKTEGAFKDECQLTHKEIENYFIIDESCPLKNMTDLNRLSKEALAIAEKRRINGAKISTKTNEMLKHAATEVVEATEAYQYYICEIPYKYEDIELYIEDLQAKNKERFTSELADVIMCILIIAADHDIDIEQALKDTLEKNKKRASGEGDKL